MKRDHPNPLPLPGAGGKAKMWEDDTGAAADGCMDEHLEVMGYKVRNSDMAVVAQQLEQLEEVLSREDGLSQVASESIHYNPADLSTWLESMLSEINPVDSITPPPSQTSFLDDSCYLTPPESSLTSMEIPNGTNFGKLGNNLLFDESSSSDYDLKVIPGKAVLSSSSSSREPKRLKTSVRPEPARTVVIESQENGVRLVHLLMACAESVQKGNLAVAEALVREIGVLAVSQAGAMRKVATYFAEALARRIYNLHPDNPIHHSFSQLLHLHFYESCPYLKFAHFTANQAILEAFEGKTYVHVIDFSINQGMQWPALIQALAVRPGGPPAFRLTGIGPPSDDNSDHLQQVGWKLAQLAETIGVQFEYRGFVANSLADLDAVMLELRPTECIAVNSVFELHKLHARPGAFEKVMNVIKQIKPDIFTVVEQEANHNGPVFLDRFTESLHYYSTLFDSLESSAPTQDKVMSEMYLGKEICNVVACEGVDRVERHESLDIWRTRLSSGGFSPVHLGSNAFKQARMLLALYAGVDGYKVEEDNGCLMLGWHTRPLIATSAWRLACKLVGAQ